MHNFDFLLKEYVYDRNKQQIQRRIIDKQTVNETLEYIHPSSSLSLQSRNSGIHHVSLMEKMRCISGF